MVYLSEEVPEELEIIQQYYEKDRNRVPGGGQYEIKGSNPN